MMRKKIVSLCMALALCLGLLPVTALAVDAPENLYVGDQVCRNEISCWTTNSETGELTEYKDGGNDWNVKYDPSTATLTLKNATIKTTTTYSQGAVIYAESRSSSAVSLTIELEGTNKIECDTAFYGIYVNAEMSNDRYGTDASLTITGKGSLDVSGSSHGIWVKSGSGNASLTIENASVVANTTSQYSHGVVVQSSTFSQSSPALSLAVNGGSLTASGTESSDGIQFYVGSSQASDATTSLTVSKNAIVDARNGGIKASYSSMSDLSDQIKVSSGDGTNGGIVFDGSTGTVYGNVTLDESLTINQGETLTIPEGASLNANGKLTNDGTINVQDGGKLEGTPTSGSGTVVNAPTITAQPTNQTVTEGQTASFTVTATGENPTYQWSQSTDQGKSWTEISGATGSTYTTAATTTSMSGYQYRCEVSNSAGSVTSNAVTLTVNAATVSVTGVTLEPKELSLYTGQSETLAATVQPEDATNQSVTWKSSDDTIATVDSTGKVTAVGAGNATITVTTEDGEKTATCTVTVRPDIPPANPNYRITVEATQGGTVTADPTAAKAGTTVTLTPVPDRGYQVGTVAVTDRFGEAVAVTENADGTYVFTMPNGQVTVTVTFEQAPLPFHDVAEGDWFYDAVRYAYETGLMDGVGDSLFAPNSETTRAQLVTILYRLAGEPEPGGDSGFADVAAGTWYTDAVAWAAENGIANGVSDTEFAPGDDLTRQQLVTIFYRYAESKGYDVSASADLSGYPDAGQVQAYAQPAMAWAVAEGIVEGMEGTLNPAGNASRAQIATILMRFLAAVPTA